jgi:hypothetical protein
MVKPSAISCSEPPLKGRPGGFLLLCPGDHHLTDVNQLGTVDTKASNSSLDTSQRIKLYGLMVTGETFGSPRMEDAEGKAFLV